MTMPLFAHLSAWCPDSCSGLLQTFHRCVPPYSTNNYRFISQATLNMLTLRSNLRINQTSFTECLIWFRWHTRNWLQVFVRACTLCSCCLRYRNRFLIGLCAHMLKLIFHLHGLTLLHRLRRSDGGALNYKLIQFSSAPFTYFQGFWWWPHHVSNLHKHSPGLLLLN